MDLDRGTVTWSGSGIVGGGSSTFYATPGGSFMSHLKDFFTAVAPYCPTIVTFSFPSSGDTIDSATGALVGGWTGSTLTSVNGGSASSFSNRAGIAVNWLTNTIVPVGPGSLTAHKIVGRTFIVPVTSQAFDFDGTPTTAALTAIRAAADGLISSGAGHFHIWHRPPPGTSVGLAGPVLSQKIKDHTSVLRSRSV